MPQPHVIRLRGPWDYEALARMSASADGRDLTPHEKTHDDLPPPGKAQFPCDWSLTLGADFRGRVRFVRRFGLPTNLAADDRVLLAIDGVGHVGSVMLNGTLLGELAGAASAARFEIRNLLIERNQLAIEIELPRHDTPQSDSARDERTSLPNGPTGEVWLEIHPASALGSIDRDAIS